MATLEKLLETSQTSVVRAREQLARLNRKYPHLTGSAEDACTSIAGSLSKINIPAYRVARRLQNADTADYFDDPLNEAIDTFDNDFSYALSQIANSEEFTKPETYAAVGGARKFGNRCRFALTQLRNPVVRIIMGWSLVLSLVAIAIIYAIYYLYFYGSHVAAPITHPAEVANSVGNAAETAVSEFKSINGVIDGIKVLANTLTDLFSGVPPLILAGTAAFVAFRGLLVRLGSAVLSNGADGS